MALRAILKEKLSASGGGGWSGKPADFPRRRLFWHPPVWVLLIPGILPRAISEARHPNMTVTASLLSPEQPRDLIADALKFIRISDTNKHRIAFVGQPKGGGKAQGRVIADLQ